MAAAGGNPYQPGRGTAPPVLAGREPMLGLAERRLDILDAGRMPSEDVVFFGPRGTGKTALLTEIQRRARARGLRVEDLPIDALSAREQLVGHLQARAGVLGRKLTGGQIAGIEVSGTPAPLPSEIGWLFDAWIGADAAPTVVVIDEIHALAAEPARPFFDAVQSAKDREPPFLLLTAGTPDAPRRLREAATYNERGFEPIPVGRLRRPETITALAEPARTSGRPMSAEAAALLAEESQDYPFFIQLLGSAAWNHAAEAGAAGIGPEAARGGVAASRPRIERFYSGRYDEAWDRGIAPALGPLAAFFAERGGRAPAFEVEARLMERGAPDSLPMGSVGLRNALRDLGVVWEATPGIWELGIPSFAEFVLRRTRPPA